MHFLITLHAAHIHMFKVFVLCSLLCHPLGIIMNIATFPPHLPPSSSNRVHLFSPPSSVLCLLAEIISISKHPQYHHHPVRLVGTRGLLADDHSIQISALLLLGLDLLEDV
ncbi:hypothetical protein G7K_2653-t1 [Saitoella complicata NRRL Y-17804]|uniref:Uncharacterized protein n=1 Tax=Saitoella complicata (strain BCRC 22490 / CBS 7301 / JCM 7358 / NBRC 10748 / NRRL Y-17804) TaxID=698492 RepID=A0A0E9NGE9_SAICN|nr:hypothetical protein G7K_2653-t1 [Saitoella complicata NRRL Y-17804]